MPNPVRFQVLVLPNVPWPVLMERFVRLEALGIEVAALPDHFVDWTNPPSPWFESWTALTGLASATTTIRLTTCVTQIPLRDPAMFARQAMTLDHVSGGRLEIGLGTGLVGDPSYPMLGVEDWAPKERVARFAEYAEIVDRLLRDEVTTFAGAYYRVDGAIVNPRPVQRPRPPITIGANGPAMMRHAARLADTWSTLSFHPSFNDQVVETRQRMAVMDGICEAQGRDPATLRRSYLMYDAQARPRGGSYDCYESVDRFESMAGRILELGMGEIVLYYPPDPRQLPTFERIAGDVLPRLRTGLASRGSTGEVRDDQP
jgi:alkanesulfonate monooxygenase SsuD/methylene tetrahydromethanopterin reductase-like flavin-dependent oxidoreductase (luciferase family)